VPDQPLLVPRPRSLTTTGPGPAAGAPITERRVAGLRAEAYELDLTVEGGELRSSTDAGLRHGRRTLEQLRQAGPALPGLRIRDWPDFAVRGYMLDISRDRVPTRQTLERLVGLLALVGMNHLELYTEHTFAYRDHADVWRDASPMTPEDIRWLDDRCRAEGIELVANQNCFGHMERWLRLPAYRHRAEAPDGYEPIAGLTRPPSVLAPTADNAGWALGLLAELLPNFSATAVNIGCDETFELGLGVSAAMVAERGKAAVYAEHLARLVGPLAAEGRQVLFWDDVARHDRQALDGLDPSAVAVVWNYEAPGPPLDPPAGLAEFLERMGVDLDPSGGFSRLTSGWASSGRPFWVAPGTSSWNSLVGRIDNATANLLDAARAGLADGASGFLITDWGDGGHLQPPSVSFGPLVYGGAVSWCASTNADLDVAAVLDRFVFDGSLGGVLDRVGRVWGQTGQRALNGSPLDAALSGGGTSMVLGRPDADAVAAVVGVLDAALGTIAAATPACADGPLVQAELAVAVRLARVGAWRLLEQAGVPTGPWPEELASLRDAYRAAWLARSRPGGLADSAARLAPA